MTQQLRTKEKLLLLNSEEHFEASQQDKDTSKMPGGKGKGRAKTPMGTTDCDDDFLLYDDEPKTASSRNHGTKRMAEEIEYSAISTNEVGDVEKLLANFGADFTKSIQNKRKKLDTFTQETLQSSNKKMVEINMKQNTERHKLIDSYCKQVDTVLSQWEEDMIKTKEGEEKLALLMKQHHKMVQQQRVVQTQRYKTIKQLKEDFTKNIELLEENHDKQLSKMQNEMKEEMMQLRKKILMESQQQEMSSVKRSLQLLAQVGEE